jgi:hypothetical protein
MTHAEDECVSALFDMATSKIEEQREYIERLRSAVLAAIRFLSSDDGNGFGTQQMEYSDFYMAAGNLEKQLREALDA